MYYGYLFFFQAEAGIRDHCVTGVQTCALPIFSGTGGGGLRDLGVPEEDLPSLAEAAAARPGNQVNPRPATVAEIRSEERRVGKERRSRWWLCRRRRKMRLE